MDHKISTRVECDESNNVCQTLPNYEYEYTMLLAENRQLKESIDVYRNIIEELGLLLNKNLGGK